MKKKILAKIKAPGKRGAKLAPRRIYRTRGAGLFAGSGGSKVVVATTAVARI